MANQAQAHQNPWIAYAVQVLKTNPKTKMKDVIVRAGKEGKDFVDLDFSPMDFGRARDQLLRTPVDEPFLNLRAAIEKPNRRRDFHTYPEDVRKEIITATQAFLKLAIPDDAA